MNRKFLTAMLLFALAWLLALCAGCFAPTQSTVREFDIETGAMIRETVSSESVVKNITEATQNKTIIAFDDGWAAYISVSMATLENPTPTGKMFAGSTAHSYLSIHKDQQNMDGIASIIQAIRAGSLSVNKDGIEANAATSPRAEASP